MLDLWSATASRIQDCQVASIICKVAHAVLALSGREGSGGMEVRGRVREVAWRQRGEEGAASGWNGTVRCRRDLRVRLRLRLRVFDSFCGSRKGADANDLSASCAVSVCLSVCICNRSKTLTRLGGERICALQQEIAVVVAMAISCYAGEAASSQQQIISNVSGSHPIYGWRDCPTVTEGRHKNGKRNSLGRMAVAVRVVARTMSTLISLQFAGRRSPARAPGGGARAAGNVGGMVFVVSLVSGQGWKRLDSDVGGGAVGACARRGANS